MRQYPYSPIRPPAQFDALWNDCIHGGCFHAPDFPGPYLLHAPFLRVAKADLRLRERAAARVYLAKMAHFLNSEKLAFLHCSLKHIIYYFCSIFVGFL